MNWNYQMRRIVSASLGALMAMTGAVAAQETQVGTRPVVVELYTSQGCSSCPPADEILAAMAADPSIIALALHVDYWDYLGWKDDFASPQFTSRQKAYAKAIGDRMIYTPQMIVGGVDRIVGSRPAEILEAVRTHAALPVTVRLTARRDGDTLHIRAEAVEPQNRPLRIDLVRYLPSEKVAIERGENAGVTMTYTNIVTNWDHLADWTGAEPLELEVPLGGGAPVVVLVQSEGPAEIVAAAALK